MTNEELWQVVLSEVELALSKASFITWFKHTSISQQNNHIVTVCVPNAFSKEWLENKYHKIVLRALRSANPDIRSVEYVISSAPPPTLAPPSSPVTREPQKSEEQLEFHEFQVDKETNLNSRYTFDSFIVGSFNELAHAAAKSIVTNIGSLYNPLFIYGGVGLGKTHLLQAIGNEAKNNNPALRVHYTTSETFTNNLIAVLQNKEPMQQFKEQYRKFDVLIVDDIQFIAGKVRTQEEFFHTFNALYEQNKQIIFSSDRAPKSIPDLEERLRSRFEAGLIADISQPDYETRLAILKVKTAAKSINVPLEILEFIASSVEKNIRELEGCLNLVIAKTNVVQKQPSLEELKNILTQISSRPRKVITASKIIKEVCTYYDIQERFLFERSRRREVVKPRQIAMYLLREDFHGSFPYIGQRFGGRDHTTAIHAYEKIIKNIQEDQQLADEIRTLRETIYNN